ncbi:MAG: hypothetical protein RLZZ04_3735 [Cyanobacteriota bacterium]|jgi:hypothetical protein
MSKISEMNTIYPLKLLFSSKSFDLVNSELATVLVFRKIAPNSINEFFWLSGCKKIFFQLQLKASSAKSDPKQIPLVAQLRIIGLMFSQVITQELS